MEALIFCNGAWICTSGLPPALLRELRQLAEDPGCSDKRYRLVSVILNAQEIPGPQEPAEAQVDPADEQQGEPSDESEEGTSKKRKAAVMEHS